MSDTLLVVEDESDVVDLLRYTFTKAGLTVLTARDGLEGLQIAKTNRPHLIVLDLLLPQMDGFAVCRALKNNSETAALPIVMLTARGASGDRIKGLEIGADDYVTKPFSPRELLLRVQGLLRRSRLNSQKQTLETGSLQVDKNRFEVRLAGQRLDLTTTEFKLLKHLIERPGRTQSRETLLHDVWGYQNSIDTRTVDTHIRRVREKLGDYAGRLETVRSQGYRFNGA